MNSKSNPIVSLRWKYEAGHGLSGCDHALAQWRRSKNFFSTELDQSVETVATMEGGPKVHSRPASTGRSTAQGGARCQDRCMERMSIH